MTGQALPYPNNILPRLRYRYCPMCATPLVQGTDNQDNHPRILCPACGWVHYPTHVTGVCVIVEHEDGIIAMRPAGSSPGKQVFFPSGHCEYGESPEDAARREVLEETGLEVEIDRCLGWHFVAPETYPGPNVTFFFTARASGGELRPSPEGEPAAYALADMPPIRPTHRGSNRAYQLYLESLAGGGS